MASDSNIWIALLQLHLLLFGLAAAAGRSAGSFPLSRIWSPVLVTLAVFFVEHFFGLGGLRWLGVCGAVAAAVILYLERRRLAVDWEFEIAFGLSFLYAFLWRYTSPDLHGDMTEKLTDVSFVLNYSRGETLPPVDSWLPPYPFAMYYSFQHYAAGLMARILGVEAGVAYNFAFCTVVALVGASAFFTVRHFTSRKWQIWLIMASLLIGGSGASLALHAMKDNPMPIESMRFIGGSAKPEYVSKPAGKWLTSGKPGMALPIETLGFLVFQGEYHPPLSGFLLLGAALACIVLLEGSSNRAAQAMLAVSVPLAAASSAWTTPLQGLLIAGWIVYRIRTKKPVDWKALAMGGAGVVLLLAPFFYYFAATSGASGFRLKFVGLEMHAPLTLGLILLGPPLLIIAAQLVRRDASPLGKAAALFFAVCFLLSELFYLDDPYGQQFERFNTTLKWWGWIFAGTYIAVAPDALRAGSRWIRGVAIIGVLIPCAYAYDLGVAWVKTPKSHAGILGGWGAVVDDPVYRAAFEYLKARPPATVLELVEAESYTRAPSLTILAGHTAFIGWSDHENVWRGTGSGAFERIAAVRQFYMGGNPNAAQWLKDNGITHVFWLPSMRTLPAGAFESVSAALRDSPYHWKELQRTERGVYGVWSLE